MDFFASFKRTLWELSRGHREAGGAEGRGMGEREIEERVRGRGEIGAPPATPRGGGRGREERGERDRKKRGE